MQQWKRDRELEAESVGFSLEQTQFVAIIARFVAAVTGDWDRWLP
jgi:hypothetical protein